jgi:hypothetical protein
MAHSEFGNGKPCEYGDIASRYVLDNVVITKYVSGITATRPIKYYTSEVLATIPVKTYGSPRADKAMVRIIMGLD